MLQNLPTTHTPAAEDPPGIELIPAAARTDPSSRGDLVVLPTSTTRRRGIPRWVRRTAAIVALFGVWQLITSTGTVDPTIFSSPESVFTAARQLFDNGQLVSAVLASLERVALGLLFGMTVGLTLAVMAGLSKIGEDLIDPPLQMLRTVPIFALIPLLIVWFGIGETAKVVFVSAAVCFPVYLNTYSSIRNVDAGLVDAGRVLGLRRVGLVRHVVLPAALPGALVGVRYALGVSWLALIFAEQVNASSGIGALLSNAQNFNQTNVIILCVVIYAVLGLTADLIVRFLERVLLAWRPTFSGS
jgi:sulfonate transport system permease protein